MCPACIATVALIAAKTGTAAGVAAFASGAAARMVKRFRPKREASASDRTPPNEASKPEEKIR
jgi:hypothetical protein